ncbi:hypothetical protein HY212_06610 [Candidatus Pacearchaeota archaeon]|nr:hypothetical protein [Candidatus Pacearchaeota archaeon]
MVYKRYIYRNGKKFGPYYYHTYRDKEGKTHSRYIEDKNEIGAVTAKNRFNSLKQHRTLFILLGAIALFLITLIILSSSVNQGQSSSSSFSFKTLGDNIKSFVTGFTSEGSNGQTNTDSGSQPSTDASTPNENPTASEPQTTSTETQPSVNETINPETNVTTETNTTQQANETATNETAADNGTINGGNGGNSEGVIGNSTNATINNQTINNETTFNSTNETFGNFSLNETNITVLNETNVTIINETANITLETSVKQFDAVLGKPVRWEKKVKVNIEGANSTNGLVIDIPNLADNVSVKKISDKGEEGVDATVNNGKKSTETKKAEEINSSASGNFFTSAFNFVLGFFSRGITGGVVQESQQNSEVQINQEIKDNDEVVVDYYTIAPYSEEQDVKSGKKVKVVGPEDVHYENILAFTELNESLIIKDPSRVKIYWEENKTYLNFENVNDTNGNGVYDYVSWIVPHLSNQTFDIIVITKAEHLDENRSFISDIYEQVKSQDNIWSEEIPNGDYVRITFERNLTSNNDITIYPRIISGSPRIEVYEENGNDVIAEFASINSNEYNKVYLTNLTGEQDTFDLKVLDGNVEFDHIVDPSPSIATYLPNQANQVAYKGSDDSDPPTLPYNNSNVALASVDLNNISLSDNQRANVSYVASGSGQSSWNHLEVVFKINESASSINNITFTWEGYNSQNSEANSANDLRLYIYNHTGSSWGSELNTTCANNACKNTTLEKTVTYVINSTTTNISQFVNSTGHVRFLATEFDADLLCPFVYSWNGAGYVFDNYIIKGLMGKDKEALQLRELKKYNIINKTLNLQVREEVDEKSYLDLVYLVVNDTKNDSWITYNIFPSYISKNSNKQDLSSIFISDNNYLVTKYKDILNISFENIPALLEGYNRSVFIAGEGYWNYNNYSNEFRDMKLSASKKVSHHTLYTDLMKIDVNYNATDTFPQWSANSTNSTSKNTPVLHNVYWTDDTALSGYIFSFDNGNGTLYNDSWVAFTGTTNWSNVTKIINSTNKVNIRWIVYANDSANQLNATSTFSYNTTNDAPTQSNPIFLVDPVNNDQNLTCLNQSTSDPNADIVTNVYTWDLNSTSILLLNLPFDTNVSSTATNAVRDYSGYGNNGTLNISSGSPLWNVTGKIGGAYEFNRNGSINITKSASLNSTYNFSIEFWIYPKTISATEQDIFTNSLDTSLDNGEIFITSISGGLTVDLKNFSGSSILKTASSIFSASQWQHIVIVETSGSGLTIYQNGTSFASLSSIVTGPFLTSSTGFYIGVGSPGTTPVYLNSSLDNFRIWNRSLSAAEVSQLYLDGKNGWSNSSTIVSQESSTSENWTCEVTPNDVISDGTTKINYTTILANPKWSSNSTNSTEAGSVVSHNVKWDDDTALSGYTFSFDNGTGTFTNDSFIAMTGTTNWSNVTKVINSTAGSKIQWRVYANNSNNVLNVTDLFVYNNTCGNLIKSLTLSNNASSVGTCFTIGANNITLDCNGYVITYGTGASSNVYGIESSSYNNSIIKNCIIQKSNASTTVSYGIYLHNNVNNNTITSNNITTNGSGDYGVMLSTTAYNNSVYSNNITTNGSSDGYGIVFFTTAYNNSVYSNNITTSGLNGFGVYLISTAYNNSIYSNNITTSGSSAYGIYLQTNVSNNNFTGNTITTAASSIYLDGTTTAVYNNLFADSNITNNSATSVESKINASQNTLLNMIFNKSKVVFTSCVSCNLTVQWYYRTNVTDQRFIAVQSATVTVQNVSGTQIDSQSTDSNGLTNYVRVTEYIQNGTSSYTSGCAGSGVNITCQTPHNVTASKSGYGTNSTNVTIDSSMTKLILIPTPYILAYVPVTDNFSIAEPSNQTFSITFTNTTNVYIKWYVNGTEQTSYQNNSQFIWAGNYTQAGTYQIKVNISNNIGNDYHIWVMAVNDTNTAPTQSNPLLSPYPPTDSQNITCTNQSTSDAEGDSVTNVYNWLRNSTSILALNMPFEINSSNTSAKAIKDYSGNGNNATLAGPTSTPTWKLGKVGGSYDFDGVDDYMTIPSTSSLNSTHSNMTFAFWVNPKTPIAIANNYFFWKGDGTGTNDEYNIRLSSSKILVTLFNQTGASSVNILSNSSLSNNVFTFVAFTYNGTNLSIYLNGTLENSTNTGITLRKSSNSIWISYDLSDVCPQSCNTNSTLDEIKLYNRTLSPGQIYQLYLDGKNGWSNSSTIHANETLPAENWTCEVTPSDSKLDGIKSINSTTISSDFSVAIDLSPLLGQQINWTLASLPAFNQSALSNNGTGISQYWVNVSVTGGNADLYMKANDNLTTPGGDILSLGNETYSYNSSNSSVPSDFKTSLTTNYSNHKIGDTLPAGNTLVYLKFFLSAPSGQPAGVYNNSLLFEVVQAGQAP